MKRGPSAIVSKMHRWGVTGGGDLASDTQEQLRSGVCEAATLAHSPFCADLVGMSPGTPPGAKDHPLAHRGRHGGAGVARAPSRS